ncbi:MAG: LysR family transcriptional regulator [Clostridiales bacterium]|nr:LysR family transcriptional regulator [Clostridiales bacterium]
MELKHLTCFKRVAELEHLTRAANELYMSQSRLSHVIAELEAELGVKLFDREGRGIKLNPCGKAFYRDVVNIMYQIEDSAMRVRELDRRQSIQLTIATNVSTYMAGLLHAAQEASTGLVIRQYSADRRKITRMLIDGDIDYALCCPILTEERDLTSSLLYKEKGVVIYPPNHWLKDHKTVSFHEIKNERFINVGVGYGIRDVQDAYFSQLGIFPDIVIETTDTSSIFNYVQEGLGIAIAPRSMTLRHPLFSKRYAEITEETIATIGLTWRNNHYITESRRVFFDAANIYFSNLKAIVKSL